MRKVVVSFQNGLLAEAITAMLNDSGEFQTFCAPAKSKKIDVASTCEMLSADLVLMEVSYSAGTAVEVRRQEARELRRRLPDCRIVLLCDENSAPEIAREVMLAKKDGTIDNFFYTSVTSKYLLAALIAL